MSYQVLARKWRPQTFEEVIGQKHVSQTLKNAIRQGKIAHAFLFSGERGVGKTSIARILAKALNCHSKPEPTEIPCNTCPSCKEITAGNSMDVLEIDGASNTGVDDVRILRENVRYKPARDRYKVYIIDEVHMLSKAAFNALLKTLEEPPPHTIFMFATTEPEKLPDTIISRCLRFDLKRIATQEIIAQLERLLKDERIHISKRGLFLIARAAEGSMRDAQSLLDRILAYCPDEVKDTDIEELLGRVDRSFLFKITEALAAADPAGCLTALNTLYESGFDLRQFYYAYLEHLRDLMVAKVSSGSPAWMDMPEEEVKEVARLAQSLSTEKLQRVFRLWYAAENEINQSPLPKVALEMCLLEMIHAQQSMPVEEVLQKLDALQQKITGAPGAQSPGWSAPAKSASPAGKYSPVKNPAASGYPARAEAVEQPETVLPDETTGKRDAAEFLAFVRQRNLPLASQLEHGTMRLQDDRELLIELPDDSFFLETINDRETGNKIKGLCAEFFKKQLQVTVVPVKKAQQHAGSQPKELDRKKKVHDAMHNPLIQKIVETFEGEIVEVKTDI
jgi:DNA polymerase-3 subunit gamma/tau